MKNGRNTDGKFTVGCPKWGDIDSPIMNRINPQVRLSTALIFFL